MPIARKAEVRLVLDTNTAISGLLWHGVPGRLIEAALAKSISLYTSAPLLIEMRGVLERQKFAGQLETRGLTVAEVFDGYAALAIIVTPAIITPTIAKDPTDDVVLATALAARSNAIVSGGGHLLDLKVYRSIPILTAVAALQFVAKAR